MRQALIAFARNPLRGSLLAAIRGYQLVISPGLPGRCKYYPSCSQYTLEAVKEYGAARGLVLGAWRILRCNPLSYGGYDPVSRQRLFAVRKPVGPVGGAIDQGESGADEICPHQHGTAEGLCGQPCGPADGPHARQGSAGARGRTPGSHAPRPVGLG